MTVNITPTHIVKTLVEIYNEQQPTTPVSYLQDQNDNRNYTFRHGEFVAFNVTIIEGLPPHLPTFVSLGSNKKQDSLILLTKELDKRFEGKLQIIVY